MKQNYVYSLKHQLKVLEIKKLLKFKKCNRKINFRLDIIEERILSILF